MPHRTHGLNLGVRAAAAGMETLPYDFTVMHNHRAHHGIGGGITDAVPCDFKAAAHVNLILLAKHQAADSSTEAFSLSAFSATCSASIMS